MERNRRAFLRLALAVVAAPAPSACSGGDGMSAAQTFGDVPAGNTNAIAVGAVKALAGAPAFIARDEKGLYAMTTTCTHQGCDLAANGLVSGSQIRCGCHGSVFDANGAVMQGPAQSPLQHFAVSVDERGEITVHGAESVAEDVRVTLP